MWIVIFYILLDQLLIKKRPLTVKNMFFAQNEPKIAILGRFSKFSHSNRFLPLDMAMIHA